MALASNQRNNIRQVVSQKVLFWKGCVLMKRYARCCRSSRPDPDRFPDSPSLGPGSVSRGPGILAFTAPAMHASQGRRTRACARISAESRARLLKRLPLKFWRTDLRTKKKAPADSPCKCLFSLVETRGIEPLAYALRTPQNKLQN